MSNKEKLGMAEKRRIDKPKNRVKTKTYWFWAKGKLLTRTHEEFYFRGSPSPFINKFWKFGRETKLLAKNWLELAAERQKSPIWSAKRMGAANAAPSISQLERVMGIEPTISSLARKHCTTQLHPHYITFTLNDYFVYPDPDKVGEDVPRAWIEHASDALQAPAVTTLATSTQVVGEGFEPPTLRM